MQRMLRLVLALTLLTACAPPLTPAPPANTPAATIDPAASSAASAPVATNAAPSPAPVVTAPSDNVSDSASVTIKALMGQAGPGADLDWELARTFEAQTGIAVQIIEGPESVTDRLFISRQFLVGQADVDVFMIDVTWPGIVAPYAVDLMPALADQAGQHFPAIVASNTIDGKLVGMPYFTDAGLLYYRRDLLQQYGYQQPPATWAELEEMAATIQAGEQARNPNFWGYVWQGDDYEGLTCNALEWQASSGGGLIVEADGRISVNNPQTIAALERAQRWVGTISSPGVFTYKEEDARREWQAGNAAFMRNWPYAYALGQAADSPIKDLFDVTTLPKGDGLDGRSASTLGGWQLMVSASSKQQAAAIEYIKFMTSPEVQKQRAARLGNLPTIPTLYDDADLRAELPFLDRLKPVFSGGTVARPSAVSGTRYGDLSAAYFTVTQQVITGQQSADDAMADLERRLGELLQ